jgi:hypothetical protein
VRADTPPVLALDRARLVTHRTQGIELFDPSLHVLGQTVTRNSHQCGVNTPLKGAASVPFLQRPSRRLCPLNNLQTCTYIGFLI